jgi:telomere length regulation protein
LHQYRGAGTGLILSSLVLSHLLATLGVLVHTSQNAPAWLAVVAPDALELAITLGTRSISRGGEEEEEFGGGESGSDEDKDARVLATASRSADEKEKENGRTRWLQRRVSRLPARGAPHVPV